MPDEEKELTIEEMRRLISVDALLPDLLNKIKEIENKITTLNSYIDNLIKATSKSSENLVKYKDSVDNSFKKQISTHDLYEELNAIKEAVARIEAANSISSDVNPKPKQAKKEQKQPAQQKTVLDNPEKKVEQVTAKKIKEEPKVESYQNKSKEDLDAVDFGTKILASSRGRKTRTLTIVDVKKAFSIDDNAAQKVLDWLESKKVYNPKTHILTFKK